MPKVLISDKMDPLAAETFKKHNVDVDVITGLDEDGLCEIISNYDGLALRSSTTVTPKVLEAAKGKLKVIGRAGIGVDNIDVKAATAAGVIVMNTPFGNSITTAEHAIAMMFALARDIPQANESTHAGKWEKKKFMGVELYSKVLGVIGCGNIGAIVANRALGLHMDVIAFDPFLSDDRAKELGVEKVSLDDLLARADFITMHVPKNEKTANLLNKETLAKTKKGVRIINCARGGIINEADLKEALDSGHVAGAALDVFEKEPARENALFGHPNVICTPHLGASTTEAQVNVALQVAEQIADYLNNGAITNALNMASISAEEAPRLKPFMGLACQMGDFAGQLIDEALDKITVEYIGAVTELNVRPLTATILAHTLSGFFEGVNLVNAEEIAKSRDIDLSVTKSSERDSLTSGIRLVLESAGKERSVTGTLFANGQPRLVNIEGVPIEAAITPHMLFIRNEDKPGMIGGVGSVLGEAGINISDFRLGRRDAGTAVALVSLDSDVPEDVFQSLKSLPQIKQIKRLAF